MTKVDNKKIDCLDKGFVRLVDHMGNDKRIVDAARVSYQNGTTKVQDDRNLIRYMLRNAHWTPFEKVVFEFHIKCPMFIGEQWLRHRMGSFNKISGRYSVMKDEFYEPNVLRKQSTTNNQGSSEFTLDETVENSRLCSPRPVEAIRGVHSFAYENYEALVEEGAAKELARGILPANLYTEFYWTVNLRSLFNFLELRLDSHAQYEIRVFAQAVFDLVKQNTDLPAALEAFQDYVLDDPKLTKYEVEALRKLVDDLGSSLGTPNKQIQELLIQIINTDDRLSKREKAESKLITFLE